MVRRSNVKADKLDISGVKQVAGPVITVSVGLEVGYELVNKEMD